MPSQGRVSVDGAPLTLDAATEHELYGVWLDYVDRGGRLDFRAYLARIFELRGEVAAALAWCEDNSDSIEHAPQYSRIRQLRAQLKLQANTA